MKKWMIVVAMAAMLAGTVSAPAVNPQRGGIMGFIAGCCFGVRSGAAYNDGKEVHWREWVQLVPVASIVFAVWNGIDGANGWTSKDYATQYGNAYY